MNRTHLIPLTSLLPAWCRRPLLPVAIGKEWHALGPFWLTSFVLAAIVGLAPDGDGMSLALLALVLSNAALGASVVGHEFSHRTLGMLLTQPVRRDRLWRRKLGVATAALVIATLPVCLRLVTAERLEGTEPAVVVAVAAGSVLSGLGVAPWLTLLTRSTLAGTVFTGALPMIFGLVGMLVSQLLIAGGIGVERWSADQVGIGLVVVLLIAHWPAGAYLAHRKFLTLETFDGRGQELPLPRWRRARSVTGERAAIAGGWARQVVRKELRLQQVSFLVAGLFAALWGLVSLAKLLRPDLGLSLLAFSTPLYACFIALLVGSLACAEERQFGTLAGQLSLPVSAARQWTAKLGAVLALALVLGVLLPAGLRALTPFDDLRQDTLALDWTPWLFVMIPMTVLLGCIGLYASSVCQTTVRALLVSILVWLVLSLFGSAVQPNGLLGLLVSTFGSVSWTEPLPERYLVAITVFLLGLVLALHGLANYRTVEQRFGRVLTHLALVSLYALAAFGGYAGWGFALAYWHKDQPTEQPDQAMVTPLPPLAPSSATNRPVMDVRMLMRYGLIPKGMKLVETTNETQR